MTSSYRKNTSNTTSNSIYLTQQTADSRYLNAADNEVINGTLLVNNEVSVANCFTAGANSLILSTIPITDVDLTSSINDDKKLVNKKYTDTAIATCPKLSTSNTFSGTTNTFSNNLTVTNTLSASSSAISLTLLPRLGSQITPSDNKDLATKKYCDDTTSAISLLSPSMSDTCIFGLQTFSYYNSSNNNYYFVSPPSQTTPYSCYINFPAATSGRYYMPTVSFNFRFSYTQAQAISSSLITAINGNGAQTYTTATLQPNNIIIPQNPNSGISPQFALDSTFLVSLANGLVYASAPLQSSTIWSNPSNAVPRGGAVNISAKYGSGTPTTYSFMPIQFAYVNETKFKIMVNFPVLTNSTITQNDPRVQGWFPSANFSISLNASAPLNNNLISTLVSTPSIKTNTNSGGAYITLD